ncbi:hypothetical protein HGA88_06490 [Candidatus Roizmanbacteria bacterium]|nr:hypothetical protein [Candidatus Roizmanbacteria bacterium]
MVYSRRVSNKIAPILSVSVLFVIGVVFVIGSLFINSNKKISTSTKAAESTMCIPSGNVSYKWNVITRDCGSNSLQTQAMCAEAYGDSIMNNYWCYGSGTCMEYAGSDPNATSGFDNTLCKDGIKIYDANVSGSKWHVLCNSSCGSNTAAIKVDCAQQFQAAGDSAPAGFFTALGKYWCYDNNKCLQLTGDLCAPTAVPTATPRPTSTPVPTATTTPTPTRTPTPTPTPTTIPGATATPTPTSIPGTTSTPTPTPTKTPTPTAIPGTSATPIVTPSSTTTPTPTSVASSVTLNLKLKFLGVNSQPKTGLNSMTVKISVQGGSLGSSTVSKAAAFTADTSGIWTSSVAFNLTPGSGYTILVKGPKHLQKKVCVATPTESTAGLYQCGNSTLTLNSGINTLNFSGISLLPGDLAINNGSQRGVVDSLDLTTIRNLLSKTDSSSLNIADLNLDGVVDTQDYSLVLYTLSIRNDEE